MHRLFLRQKENTQIKRHLSEYLFDNSFIKLSNFENNFLNIKINSFLEQTSPLQ